MPSVTTNYDFYLPLVNDPIDEDLWGGYLNTNWTNLDSYLPVPTASKYGAIVVQNTADLGFELITNQGTSGYPLVSSGADALPAFGQIATAGIADDAVTYAKIQDVAANSVLARGESSGGVVQAVALAASTLLGRGASGNVTQISIDSTLSFTGNTLGAVVPTPTGTLLNVQFFTASGTYTKTAGTNKVLVYVTGGGGGLTSSTPVAGGTSSFGSHCSATGGQTSGAGGIGSSGDLNFSGSAGLVGTWGGSPVGLGGASSFSGSSSGNAHTRGYGGGAGETTSPGGGGGTAIKYITSGIGATETVTIGAGGGASNLGAPGVVIVYEYS